MIEAVNGKTPRVDPSVFVAPGAVILGDVELGPEVNIWYGSVLRGDVNQIRVGAGTNIQDGCIVHVNHRGQGTHVGREVMVGHRVVLHDCTVEDYCLIGIGAVVLDGAVIKEGAMVAAGSVVLPGTVVPARSFVAGVPAAPRREVKAEEIEAHRQGAARYVRLSKCHQDRRLLLDQLATR